MIKRFKRYHDSEIERDLIGTVIEETDETLLWLELLIEAGLAKKDQTQTMVAETTELLKIFSKSLLTAKNSNG